MTARIPPGGDAAVSSVLGAVLVFGLLIVTLTTIQVQFVPVWEEDREARHMDALVDQLAALKSDLDRQATNATGGPVVDPLTLRTSGGFRFFRNSASLGGTTEFVPSASGSGLQLTSPQLRIQASGGQSLFGLGEEWTTITTATTVEDVTRIDHLRMRIDMDPGDYDDGDTATLAVTDGNGAHAGRAVITFRDFPSEQALLIETFDASGQISTSVEAFFQQTDLDHFYFDLLDDGLLFDQVLAAAAKPLDLALARDGLAADYTIAAATAGGGDIGSSGLVVPNYAGTLPSGSLVIQARNQYFEEQTYILEHGALLLEQSDGAAMVVPPSLAIRASATSVALDWVVPGLDGQASASQGERSVSVVATPAGSRTDLAAAAARVAFQVPTERPEVWRAFFDDRLSAAGLSDVGASPQYNVTAAAGSVLVTLFGPASDTSEDVSLRFQQATIALEIRPAG